MLRESIDMKNMEDNKQLADISSLETHKYIEIDGIGYTFRKCPGNDPNYLVDSRDGNNPVYRYLLDDSFGLLIVKTCNYTDTTPTCHRCSGFDVKMDRGKFHCYDCMEIRQYND